MFSIQSFHITPGKLITVEGNFKSFPFPHCRCHVVEEFNRGIYDYIIATDEAHSFGRGSASSGSHSNKKRPHKRKRDKEYGVARGIDFQGMLTYLVHLLIWRPCTIWARDQPSFHTGVENIINFDFPPTPNDYVHRVGRYVYTYCQSLCNCMIYGYKTDVQIYCLAWVMLCYCLSMLDYSLAS